MVGAFALGPGWLPPSPFAGCRSAPAVPPHVVLLARGGSLGGSGKAVAVGQDTSLWPQVASEFHRCGNTR